MITINRKIQVLFILLIIGITKSYAQYEGSNIKVPNLRFFDHKKLHFGFIIGFNTTNFMIQHTGAATEENKYMPLYGETTEIHPGINLGIVSSYRINNYFNLRVLPGICFGQRNIDFIDRVGVVYKKPLKIKSTFIEMPILIKYSSVRMLNFKPYLIAGINPRYDLARQKHKGILLKSFDVYYEVGFGFDYYLNFFRLSTELKLSMGTLDILNHDGSGDELDIPYTQAIDKLTSRIFVLSFMFE